MEKLPHDFHPALTEERILQLGHLIRETRHRCLDYFDEEEGDSNWSYGCRARDWTRQAFRKAAKNKEMYPFLALQEDNGQRFIFTIDGIPIKFFKDDPEEPDARVRKQSQSESNQLSLFEFGGINEPDGVVWRFVVETNPEDREVIKIVFMGLDQFESTVCYYDIPLQDNVSTLHVVVPNAEEAVELPAPDIFKKKPKTDAKEVVNGE